MRFVFFVCVSFSHSHTSKKRQKGLFSTNAKNIHTLAAPLEHEESANSAKKKIRMRFVSPQGLEPWSTGSYFGEELHLLVYLCLRFLKAGLKSLFSFLC